MQAPGSSLVVSDPPAQPGEDQLRPMTQGAVLSAASRIWITAAGGITTIIMARVLGPSGWASYSIAQSLTLLLIAATMLGLDQGIMYFVSSGQWSARAALRTAVQIAAVAGGLGAIVGVIGRLIVPSAFAGLSIWLTVAAVASVPFSLIAVHTSYTAIAVDRYEASVLLPAAQATLVLVLATPAAIAFGRAGAVCATTVAVCIASVAALLWAKQRLPAGSTTASPSLRGVISFGLKGYSANGLQLINYQLDLFILSAVAAAAVVGHYALAVSVATLLLVLPSALAGVLLPRVARLSNSGHATTQTMVETKSLRHVSLLVVLSGLMIAAALELLVVPVFGADYRAATNLGLILLPGSAALGLSSVLAATLIGRGKPVYSLYGALITTPLTLGMYAILIPWLHANGAALASTLSYCATFALFCRYYRQVTNRSVLPCLIPTRSEINDLRGLGATMFNRPRRVDEPTR